MPDVWSPTPPIFSEDRVYRYVLSRQLVSPMFSFDLGTQATDLGTINFIMLNPSTADEFKNDPTIERCCRRAKALGYSTLVVTNLFAFRSTDPRRLLSVVDPVGPFNDQHISEQARAANMVIVAWGTHGQLLNRGGVVRRLLRSLDVKPYALAVTKDGAPRHPLYVPYDVQPQPWGDS